MKINDFFKRQITVVRVYGIPVRIDYRWFVVFVMMVWLTVANIPQRNGLPIVTGASAWFLGILTTFAFFLSIFGHELSHALMARMEGIEIEEIVLHPFGGLARMKNAPDNPRAELRIAVAGPAASFIFAILAFAASNIAAVSGYLAAATAFFFLFFGNLLLAVFNLFPGYPLDGGRILRALLWRRSGNIKEATRIAGICGKVIAVALIAFGLLTIWRKDLFTGLWCVLVGLFLFDAAASVVKGAHSVEQATVEDTMGLPFAIEPDVLVSHFVDTILPMHRQTSFPVAQQGRLHGILALEDLKKLPRERWSKIRARDVMRPIGPMLFVEPATTMAHANELMQRNGVGALAVINGLGQLVGFLQRGQLKRRVKA